MSQTVRLLRYLLGALLVGSALALMVYVLAANRDMADLVWVGVLALGLMGAFVLWGAANRDKPLHCTRCGTELSRGVTSCPQCGLDTEKSMWAALGEFKVS